LSLKAVFPFHLTKLSSIIIKPTLFWALMLVFVIHLLIILPLSSGMCAWRNVKLFCAWVLNMSKADLTTLISAIAHALNSSNQDTVIRFIGLSSILGEMGLTSGIGRWWYWSTWSEIEFGSEAAYVLLWSLYLPILFAIILILSGISYTTVTYAWIKKIVICSTGFQYLSKLSKSVTICFSWLRTLI
jgi:hypothetical protein